jgi:hypothetical protein
MKEKTSIREDNIPIFAFINYIFYHTKKLVQGTKLLKEVKNT